MQTVGLFGEIASPETRRESRLNEQRRKAKLVYRATSAAWKRATYRFAVEAFLPANETFIFELLTSQYETQAKIKGWPLTVEKKAFAGLQSQLVREGLIEAIPGEFMMRSQGSPAQVYISFSFRG